MRAGLLNKIIEIQKPVNSTNDYGEASNDWVSFCKTRSNVEFVTGDIVDNSIESIITQILVFTVRRYIDVDETMIIKYKDKYFKVICVEDREDCLRIKTTKINE